MVEVWREGGRRKEGRKEGRTALIKSNNPHLAGDGECFNAMVGITRRKVIFFWCECEQEQHMEGSHNSDQNRSHSKGLGHSKYPEAIYRKYVYYQTLAISIIARNTD